jgi:hypothetical protein
MPIAEGLLRSLERHREHRVRGIRWCDGVKGSIDAEQKDVDALEHGVVKVARNALAFGEALLQAHPEVVSKADSACLVLAPTTARPP